MTTIRIPCPRCQAELKLPDRKLLGRRAKCPKCEHRFVLQEPPEVELELADDSTVSTPPAAQPPVPQPEATPAPDAFDFGPATSSTVSESMSKRRRKSGRRPSGPPMRIELPGATPEINPTSVPGPAVASDAAPFPQVDPQTALQSSDVTASIPVIAPGLPVAEVTSPLTKLKKRNARRRKSGAITALVVVALLVGGGFAAYKSGVFPTSAAMTSSILPRPDRKTAESSTTSAAGTQLTATVFNSRPAAASPTAGEPIPLLYVPSGTRLVAHLRPADLWQPQRQFQEFMACLGPVGEWLAQSITTLSAYEPTEIREVTFCVILGARSTPPEYAAIVRLVDEQRRSELLEKLGGQRSDEFGRPLYIDGPIARMIVDDRTFSVGPASLGQEMIDAIEYPRPASTGIESILEHTDRDRHLTVIFEPSALSIHRDMLVAENMIDTMQEFTDWFGPNVETAFWSLHLERTTIYSELGLRNQQAMSPSRLRQTIDAQVASLPHDLLELVERMDPRQSAGQRKLIGRFPAMMKVLSLETTSEANRRLVRLTSVLPERAAPNLALATLLTWDESTRTDFTIEKPKPQSPAMKLPDLVADRLQLPIDIDFRRTPLQEAFAYIGDETKVQFDIDGDALKLAGYTQNMPQTMALGVVPAVQGLASILKQYDKMVLIVDEEKQTVTVMTKSVATDRGLTPFSVGR